MQNTQELQAKLNQISEILGTNTNVVQRIKNRINELKQEFNDDVDNGEFELLQLTGLDNEELYYDNYKSGDELFNEFKENTRGEFDFYELEEFVDAVTFYRKSRLNIDKRLTELEAMLEE